MASGSRHLRRGLGACGGRGRSRRLGRCPLLCCFVVRVGRPGGEDGGHTGGSRCGLGILMRAMAVSEFFYMGRRGHTRYASLKRTRSIVRL